MEKNNGNKKYKNYKFITDQAQYDAETNFLRKMIMQKDIRHIGLLGINGSGKSSILSSCEEIVNICDNDKRTNFIKLSYNKIHTNDFICNKTLLKELITNLLYNYSEEFPELEMFKSNSPKQTQKINELLKCILMTIFITLILFLASNALGVGYTDIPLLFTMILGLWFILLYVIISNTVSKFKIIKFKDLELTIDSSASPNHKIDNINLYIEYFIHIISILLEKNEKNVVIIEDIDRITNIESFDFLKSIFDINYSSNKELTVIYTCSVYALSKSKGEVDITKFFDTTLTVKPVHTTETLAETFNKYLKSEGIVSAFTREILLDVEKEKLFINRRDFNEFYNMCIHLVNLYKLSEVNNEVLVYTMNNYINSKKSDNVDLVSELYNLICNGIEYKLSFYKYYDEFEKNRINNILNQLERKYKFRYTSAEKNVLIIIFSSALEEEIILEKRLSEYHGVEVSKKFLLKDKMDIETFLLEPDYEIVKNTKYPTFTKSLLFSELLENKEKIFWNNFMKNIGNFDYYEEIFNDGITENQMIELLKFVYIDSDSSDFNAEAMKKLKEKIEMYHLKVYSNVIQNININYANNDLLGLIPNILLNSQHDEDFKNKIFEKNKYLFNDELLKYLEQKFYTYESKKYENIPESNKKYLLDNFGQILKYTNIPLFFDEKIINMVDNIKEKKEEEIIDICINFYNQFLINKDLILLVRTKRDYSSEGVYCYDHCKGIYVESYIYEKIIENAYDVLVDKYIYFNVGCIDVSLVRITREKKYIGYGVNYKLNSN